MQGNINASDIQERVRVLNRFREMLMRQREKFRSYLYILETMECAIHNTNIEVLEEHIKLEKHIAHEIFTVQKVLNPLEFMYTELYPERDSVISNLQKSLSELKTSVLKHNAHNREILSNQRDILKQKIQSLRIPKTPASVFASKRTSTMLDITV